MKEVYFAGGGFIAGAIVMFVYYNFFKTKVTQAEAIATKVQGLGGQIAGQVTKDIQKP